MKIEKLDGSLFDWQTWRAGSLLDLGILYCRYSFIIYNKEIIKKYAIGYCDGNDLLCRPKSDSIAVMFYKNDIQFWNHLRRNEFQEIFE